MNNPVDIGNIIHSNLQEILEGTHYGAGDRLRAAELLANGIVPRVPEGEPSEQVAQCVLSSAQFDALERYIEALVARHALAGKYPHHVLTGRADRARKHAYDLLVNGDW